MNKATLACLLALAALSPGCGSDDDEGEDLSGLPDIATFASTPSDTFFIPAGSLSKITRAHPYKGAGTSCAHQGGHVHFTDSGAPYTVDVRSPVNGTVDRVEPCYIVGANDRYGLSIKFARNGNRAVLFSMGMEPMNGLLCSGGVSGADNGFFHTYILVTEGQAVTKGQVIARMYKNGAGDGSHIHFHMQMSNGGAFVCPNIFDSTVETTFAGLYGTETCSGTPFGAGTFCYLPSSGEDLTGL